MNTHGQPKVNKSTFLRKPNWRIIALLLVNTVVIWGFHVLQRRFSSFDNERGAFTEISVLVDLAVIWVAIVLNAILVWRWGPPYVTPALAPPTTALGLRVWKWVKIFLAVLVVGVLCATSYEFYSFAYDTTGKVVPWTQAVDDDAFFRFGTRAIARQLTDAIVWRNFNPRGILLSFWVLATSFRQMNWWWGIVPLRDSRYEKFFQGAWPNLILLNAVLALLIHLCGRAVSLLGGFVAFRISRIVLPCVSQLRNWLARLSYIHHIRLGRIQTTLQRVCLALVMLLGLIYGLARYVNATAPYLSDRLETVSLLSVPNVSPIANVMISSGSKLYAGTSSGVFRSGDGGMSWHSASAGLSDTSISSLLFDSKVFYAGTSGGEIYRSEDEGTTWHTASFGLSNKRVSSMSFSGKALYVATDGDGVFRSEDRDAKWHTASIGLKNLHVLSLLNDGKALYAGTRGGIFRSEDEGANWNRVNSGLGNTSVVSMLFAGKALYVGTDGDGVIASEDEGANWHTANSGLSKTHVSSLLFAGKVLYAGTFDGGVFRSEDGGANWNAASIGLKNTYVSSLIYDGKALYAGTDGGGVFRSEDGGANWNAASIGLSSTRVSSLLFDRKALYAGTFEGGVFRSEDEGVTWQAASVGLDNTHVSSLLSDGEMLYAGTFDGGVFRSEDEGANWHAVSNGLSNTNVHALVFDGKNLYVGTLGGVFRSEDRGANWYATNAGLSDKQVLSLLFDGKALYAGTSNQVFRSEDGGDQWHAASAGLSNTNVYALVFDGKNLYAGTLGGVFRSEDRGAHWHAASAGLSDTRVYALAFNGKTLFAGLSGGGVFRSEDEGAYWRAANTGLSNTRVSSLLFNGTALYAGIYDGGVFRSEDGGANWQSASIGLSDTSISSLLYDGKALYAGTNRGVLRLRDGSTNWQVFSVGLDNSSVSSLIFDGKALFALTANGVYRSINDGESWQKTISFSISTINSMLFDGNSLYLSNLASVYRSEDGGTNWQWTGSPVTTPTNSAAILTATISSLLFDGQALYAKIYGGEIFRSRDDGAIWQRIDSVEQSHQSLAEPAVTSTLDIKWSTGSPIRFGVANQATRNWLKSLGIDVAGASIQWASFTNIIQLLSGKNYNKYSQLKTNSDIIAMHWGGTIQIAKPPVPLLWLVIATTVKTWVAKNFRFLIVFFALVLGLILIRRYIAFVGPYRLPALALAIPSFAHASPQILAKHSFFWARHIRDELLNFGDAIPTDLQAVPAPFRREALMHYAQAHEKTQLIEAKPNRIRLKAGERPLVWRMTWQQATRAVGLPFSGPTRTAIQTLCQSLAQALGLSVMRQSREYQQALVYRVEAPALRLNVPPRFPLVFLSVAQPSTETVKLLVDAVDVVKEASYFALVVPLASPSDANTTLDVAGELRRVIAQSPHVHDFIILDNDDVLDLLIARQPTDTLAQRILAQADLATVSPFQAEGPVNEAMFFGREAEVKTLIERTVKSDFAFVGNRKIGKTSLLKRSVARLQDDPRSLPLFINCQEVREADDFYTEFTRTTQLELSERTPDGFRAAIAQLGQPGRLPVLFLDEVDRLLNHERDHGERLVGKWRTMAQEGLCHFAFFGSTGLARRQDDPQSSFFNFAQQIALGYLDRKTANMVLQEPLTTLGLQLEEAEQFLSEAFAATSGHPNLTQFIGRGLVNAVNERKERLIHREDLTALLASAAFEDFYLKTIWGEAGPLEKLITLVAPVGESGFSFATISTALADEGVQADENAVAAALKMLDVYSILRREGRSYHFIPRAFQNILHRSQDVDRLIRQERSRPLNPPITND